MEETSQMPYITINENAEEGFQDLNFNIVKTTEETEYMNFQLKGAFENQIVGFHLLIKKNMQPGVIDHENFTINQDAFYPNGIVIKRSGTESDSFIAILASLYEVSFVKTKMSFL
jgi:hypothetical protein